jgi:hypothetical protein
MELEEYIRQQMSRYVADQKNIQPAKQLRKEEIPQDRVEYDKAIAKALSLHRYQEARELFKQLKDKFTKIPVEHQEERKNYFRLLQKCYRQIYEYVAERHKTVRILQQLSHNANVFDPSIPAVNLARLDQSGNPMPTIEEQMLKTKRPITRQEQELPELPSYDSKTGLRLENIPLPSPIPLSQGEKPKKPEQPSEAAKQADKPKTPSKKEDSKPQAKPQQTTTQAPAPAPQKKEKTKSASLTGTQMLEQIRKTRQQKQTSQSKARPPTTRTWPRWEKLQAEKPPERSRITARRDGSA